MFICTGQKRSQDRVARGDLTVESGCGQPERGSDEGRVAAGMMA